MLIAANDTKLTTGSMDGLFQRSVKMTAYDENKRKKR